MDSFLQDLRHGFRVLWKSPGFTAVAVIALALGIGANTVMFSVVNAVLLRPLPYPHANHLVMLFHSYPKLNLPESAVSPYGYLYYCDHAQSFGSMGALTFAGPQNLTSGSEPERVRTVSVSAGLFPTLGVEPLFGRTFRPEEDQPGNNRVVVLGYGLWKRRFGGDRQVLGKPIWLDGANYVVVGVMPESFQIPQGSELWVPLALDRSRAGALGDEDLDVIGRLKPSVTRAQLDAEMASMSEALLQQNPDFRQVGWHVIAERLTDVIRGPIRPALFILLAAVAAVMLVACANIANLLLSRATARAKEMATRASLGATRMRLICQTLTESVLLGMLGGAIGLLVGIWGIDVLLRLVPLRLPTFAPIQIDARVLGFTFGLSVLAGVVSGMFPALQVTPGRLSDALKEGGCSSAVHGREAVRKGLVVSEVALALVLLIVAGLMIRSFIRIHQVQFGFNPGHTLTGWVSLTQQRYSNRAKVTNFYDQLLESVSTLPGVKWAALGSNPPLTSNWTGSFEVQGRPKDPGMHSFFAVASPRYFGAVGIPLIAGRTFTDADNATAPPVCLIDERLAGAFFRDQDPVGKVIREMGGTNQPGWRQIVGVVGSVKRVSAVADETKGEVYLPYRQRPQRTMAIVLRTSGDPLALASALRHAVTRLDPNQALYDVLPMEQYVDNFIAQPRFNMVLLTLFGALAVLLAAIGVFGVISYWVSQRSHEIGLRMALGATRCDILLLVMRESLQLATVGVAAGLALSLVATQTLRRLLFGVSVRDPLTFTLLAMALIAVAALASFVPARRAATVDPMVALHYE